MREDSWGRLVGVIPVVLCAHSYFKTRASIHAMGGYCYHMREFIHYAVQRVRILMKTAGLVVILANPGYIYRY